MLARRPTRFEGYLVEGGSTKPWLMALADEAGVEERYVVKVFKKRVVEQGYAVAKEALANHLAGEFHLAAPQACVVRLDDAFVHHALDDEGRAALHDKHNGYHFASGYCPDYVIKKPDVYGKRLAEHDLANVYAFDALIQNIDRGGLRNKPNLLLKDDGVLLIDHEQSFIFTDNQQPYFQTVMADLDAGRCSYAFGRHLLYPVLHDMKPTEKTHLFDEFEICLSGLNVRAATDLLYTLATEFDIHLGDPAAAAAYLRKAKSTASLFCRALRDSL